MTLCRICAADVQAQIPLVSSTAAGILHSRVFRENQRGISESCGAALETQGRCWPVGFQWLLVCGVQSVVLAWTHVVKLRFQPGPTVCFGVQIFLISFFFFSYCTVLAPLAPLAPLSSHMNWQFDSINFTVLWRELLLFVSRGLAQQREPDTTAATADIFPLFIRPPPFLCKLMNKWTQAPVVVITVINSS